MDTRLRQIHKAVKKYDRALFARREKTGAIHIYTHGVSFRHYSFGGMNLLYSVPSPHYVCALTTNGTVSGTPADWGVEFLLAHLRRHDLDKNPDLLGSIDRQQAYAIEKVAKDRASLCEDMAKDQRRMIAKATDDLLVSSLIDKRKKEKWQL